MGCIVLLAACAASESQLVQEGNWYQIGYQDAVTGHTQRSYKSLMDSAQPNWVIMNKAIKRD